MQSLGNPLGGGGARGAKDTKKTKQKKSTLLTRALRGIQRLNQQSLNLYGHGIGPLCICFDCAAWCSSGTPYSGWVEAASESSPAFWGPFPPTGLPCPTIIQEDVPSLIAI